jgi:hypothetical protein
VWGVAEHVTVQAVTYWGVSIPDTLRPNWDGPEAEWWRTGVRDAQANS